jgi:hypothetical protein
MKWSRTVLPVAVLCLAAAWVARAAPRPGGLPRCVLTDREAFVLQTPALVAPPPVAAAEVSADGRYVLAVRQPPSEQKDQPPTGEMSLVLWTRRTEHSQEVWKRPPGVQEVEQISWLPGTSTALVVVSWLQTTAQGPEVHRTLLRVDAARAQVQGPQEIRTGALHVSPTQPLAVLFGGQEQSARVVHADGSLGPDVPLPRVFDSMAWSADGATFCLRGDDPPAAAGQPFVPHWFGLDLRTGAVRDLPQAPSFYEEKPPPVHLKRGTAVLKEESTSHRVSPLWLESAAKSELPRVLVCADSQTSRLAANISAVLYLSQGAAWAAPIVRMPREQMVAQLLTAGREEAVSRAKQIAVAFQMYVQDYDDMYPPAGDTVVNRVTPYVKNIEVFQAPGETVPGFVYMLDAVNERSFKDPSTTLLGYLPGPGGRAVIYVDGHVEWKSSGTD